MFFRLVSVGPPTLFSSLYPATLKCFSRLVSDRNVRLHHDMCGCLLITHCLTIIWFVLGENENEFEEIYGT